MTAGRTAIDHLLAASPPSGLGAVRRLRDLLWYDQHGLCWYCDRPMSRSRRAAASADAVTIDHCLPLSCGGGWQADNLVAACRACNAAKGALTEAEFVAGPLPAILRARHARHHLLDETA